MASEPTTRVLRKIMAWAMLPAFPMIVAAGVVFHSVTSIVCIAPLSASLFTSLLWLYTRRSDESDGDRLRRSWVWPLVDLASCLFYIGVLIPFWVIEPRRNGGWRHYYQRGVDATGIMMETYMSCFLILNMAVHGYLALRSATFLRNLFVFSRECPNCGAGRLPETKDTGKGPKYSLLGEYRDSSEPQLESARQSMDA
ncbi:hypothetical protein BS50DRAFT_679007 [Corynespora cassiicola Philippines]|uniref:MARVEL domain-containing protein n=1 Tax=Corynespora cassiicola Philippines TaxID=1448308 RepID=A0A2T2NEC2_CORCC|nr:hypothetical protein BS50DRAFT_679007 [Corynespora cassiicola Philippines]